MTLQLSLIDNQGAVDASTARPEEFEEALRSFGEFGTSTAVSLTTAALADGSSVEVPTYVNEFWTSKQRAAHSLHEISYRACFKPQLPRFFIQRLTAPGDTVYDPFMGRGTTLLEAALMARTPIGCDVNSLSAMAWSSPSKKPGCLHTPTTSIPGALLPAVTVSSTSLAGQELPIVKVALKLL